MRILGIETSCDDTAVAVLQIQKDRIRILSDFVSSQVRIHAPFGGVVPHLAVRAHHKNLPILIEKTFKNINSKKIDLMAVTTGPGLEPSLWTGINMARVLSLATNKPIVGVNHLEGHIAANWLKPGKRAINFQFSASKKLSKAIFPAICLIVSGGHTQLVLVKKIGDYKVIGQTRDDAAGEAFDKVAKLLGLGYPGGPIIALKAQKGRSQAFNLPRPMIDSPDFDFSFSGLKTAVLYLVRELVSHRRDTKNWRSRTQEKPSLLVSAQSLSKKQIADLAASFQQAVIDVLIYKTIEAGKKYRVHTIMLSGGVAANYELRRQMQETLEKELSTTSFLVPSLRYCTDNAAMIALAGYWKYERQGKGEKIEKLVARADLSL